MLQLTLSLVLLGACATTIPTPAEVVRYDGPELRACTIELGWTVGELVALCGKPDAIVRYAGHGEAERCLVYKTEAQAFRLATHAPVVAACTSTEGFDMPGAVESRGAGVHQIVAVYGLATLPTESLE